MARSNRETEKVRTKVGTLVLKHRGSGFTTYTGITEDEYNRVAGRLKAMSKPNAPATFQLRQLKLKQGTFGRLRIVGVYYISLELKNFTQVSFESTRTLTTRRLVDPD